jgi:predicted TIM-barrel fold metal-dependent hydrolase
MKSCVGVAPLAQRLLAVAGTERLVWGSDWPFISHETQATFGQTLDWFSEWIPDRTMRQAIGHTGMALHRCL